MTAQVTYNCMTCGVEFKASSYIKPGTKASKMKDCPNGHANYVNQLHKIKHGLIHFGDPVRKFTAPQVANWLTGIPA